MGYWSDKSLELEHFSTDKHVCAKCFNDYAICEYINENAAFRRCDYCDRFSRKKEIAAPFNSVFEFMMEGINTEWGDPSNEGVAWDGGWQGASVKDGYSFVYEVLGEYTENKKVLKELENFLSDSQFCEKEPYSLRPHEVLKYGWEEFGKAVKHRTRYVFSTYQKKSKYQQRDEIKPIDFLDAFGKVLKQYELQKMLPEGTKIYRARVHKSNVQLSTAKELGTCPDRNCIYSNRMSPAGIGMFYGAFDKKTALIETLDTKNAEGKVASIALFRTLEPLYVVDLTKDSLPNIPSIFDSKKRHLKDGLIFLHAFLKDLTRPVTKNGREHYEYVPTQVITEYLKYFSIYEKKTLGLLYDSSRNGQKACVLFLKNGRCVDDPSADKAFLHLKKVTRLELEHYIK